MQTRYKRNLTIVLTRRNWLAGNMADNFREFHRFTNILVAIEECKRLADETFEPLGVRDINTWVWSAQ